MKIKNILHLLFLVVLSNSGVVIAMDKPVPASEELRPIDMKLILMSRANLDIKPVLSEGANPNVFDIVGIKILDQNVIQAGVQTTIGFTPLLYACMFGNIDNAKLLLDYGADVNLKSKRSNIPPVYAAFFSVGVPAKKHYELAQLLIDHGADINVYGPGHHSFLQRSIVEKDEQFIKKLLKETKLEVNSVDINGNNALADAIMAGANLSIIRALFDAGCLPVNDYAEASLFHKAVEIIDTLMGGDTGIFDLLYEKGLDVNSKDIHNETPLHWASEMASYNVVKKLLDLGADPRIKNDKGRTALQLSAHNPSTTVNMLLKKAKQPVVVQKIIKKEEKPVLKKEEEKKAEKVVTQELPKQELTQGEKAPAKKKKRSKKKKPLVPVSEELRDVDRNLLLFSKSNMDVKPALDGGANPNIFDDKGLEGMTSSTIGFTPLLYTCLLCNINNAKALLDHGADPNLKSKDTNISPLYQLYASGPADRNPVGRYDLAILLIGRGADVTVTGPKHFSLLQAAVMKKDKQFVKYLLATGRINVNSIDDDGNNALSVAIQSSTDFDLINLLFDAEVKPVNDVEGASLMHLAVHRIDIFWGGDTTLLDLLFKKGLDVNAKDMDDQTPLHWASESCSYAVVKKLLDLGADPRIKDKSGKTAYQLSAENTHKSQKAIQLLLKNAKPPVVMQKAVKIEKQAAIKQPQETQRTTEIPKETPATKPVAEKAPAQERVVAGDKPKKEKPSLKEKLSAVKQTVVGVLNPERREASILQAGRTYAVAAGAPATRAPQPEEKLITLIDDRVDIVAYKWKPMSETNPLIGLPYSKHVQEKMNNKSDVFHNFSTQVEEQLGSFMNEKIIQEATEKHSAKIKYTIPAKMTTLNKEFEGRFEFIVRDGEIRHRFFKPDKRVGERYFEQKEKAPLLLPAAPTKYQEKDVDVKR